MEMHFKHNNDSNWGRNVYYKLCQTWNEADRKNYIGFDMHFHLAPRFQNRVKNIKPILAKSQI